MYSLYLVLSLLLASANAWQEVNDTNQIDSNFSGLNSPEILDEDLKNLLSAVYLGSTPPEFGTYESSLSENVKKAPAPFLETELKNHASQACEAEPTCEDREFIYYTFRGFLMKDITCEEAFKQTNLMLNGDACYLRAEITENEGETLWTLCPSTMNKKCGSPDEMFRKDEVFSMLAPERQKRSLSL